MSDDAMEMSDAEEVVVTPRTRRGRVTRIIPAEESSSEEDAPLEPEDEEEEDAEGDDDAEGVEEEEEEEDDDGQEEEEEEEETPPPPPRKPAPSSVPGRLPLKIKLKLPSTSASASPPVDEDGPEVESQDEDEDEDMDVEDDDDKDTMIPGPSTARLTARQAAMVGGKQTMADLETLETSAANLSRRKKKEYNDVELALKKEEMARKRKNLSEKRLQDEQNETINRLLRKQSSRRNKRNALATAEDKGAGSAGGSDEEGEEIAEELPELVPPTMFRWVSSARDFDMPLEDGSTRTTQFTFAVPQLMDVPTHEENIRVATAKAEEARKTRVLDARCAISGCDAPRKYRLVKNWTTGACGLAHLKMLEA